MVTSSTGVVELHIVSLRCITHTKHIGRVVSLNFCDKKGYLSDFPVLFSDLFSVIKFP